MARTAARSQERGFLSEWALKNGDTATANVQGWQAQNDDRYHELLAAMIEQSWRDLAAPTCAQYSGGRAPTVKEKQEAAQFLGSLCGSAGAPRARRREPTGGRGG